MNQAKWAAVLATLAACNTAYVPRSGRRLSVTMSNGVPVLERAGKHYSVGTFMPGDEVVAAVEGNAAAEEEMRTYRSQRTAGSWLGVVGGAALGVDAVYLVSKGGDTSAAVFWPLLAASFLLSNLGAGFNASASTHFLDAINIYNDAAEALPPEPSR